MKIPQPIIYTVADVLGSFYNSHTKLDTLFGEHGFPGETPQGNCVKKCQLWLKRANEEQEDEAMRMLSDVLAEFMFLERPDNETWTKGSARITEALKKHGLKYDLDGILPISDTVTETRNSLVSGSSPSEPTPTRATIYPVALNQTSRFSVALSFPGEHRDFVGQVAEILAEQFSPQVILYDAFHEAEFARPDLDVYLPALYQNEANLVCVFLCMDYARKRWCNLEWRFIRQMIATADQKRIMFLSFDDVGAIPEIGILNGDGYVPIRNRTPADISQLIVHRLRVNEAMPFFPPLNMS